MSDKKSPSMMVDAIVEKDDKLLLVRRKKIRLKDLKFPGGKVDEGEKVEDALKWEIK